MSASETPFRQSAFPQPPVARVWSVEKTAHGEVRVDPYDWLRDPAFPEVKDPDILACLNAENAYIEQVLGGEGDLRPALVAELRARIKEDDTGVPYRRDGYFYQSRFAAGQNYPVFVRWPAGSAPSAPSDEEVVLDVNVLAAQHEFMRVADFETTRDGRHLAYTADTDGSERYGVRVKDLETGELVLEGVADAAPGVVWSADGRHLFYIRQDEFQRPKTVWRHRLGTAVTDDVLVYEEADAAWMVSLDLTLSGRFIRIVGHNNVSTEVRLLDAAQPEAAPRLVLSRRQGHEYNIEDQGDTAWIITNDTHRNFRLVKAPLADTAEKNWVEVIAPADRTYLTGHMAFRDWLVVYARVDGAQVVRVLDKAGGAHDIAFPDAAFEVGPGANFGYDQGILRLRYQSLVTPPTVYDYDLKDRTLAIRKVQEIPSGYDADLYVSARLLAPARDGTLVPVSIVHRRDFPRDGSGALHLYAYGAYGHGMDPYFSASRLGLLDRGFAFAIAHIRGGDELGRGWYEDGKLEKKINSFTDFIDVAQFLVAQGYAKAGSISAEGGSAGGLLMGGVANMAPEGLFRAVVAQVPFVDVVNTMLDDSLPLTVIEYDEWGNPNEPDVYQRLKSYSPYDNVAAKAYPHLLITAGLSDPRVTYWEPAKWAAKLRTLKTDDHVLLSRTEMGAGHAGAAGRFDKLKEIALTQAFLLRAFGKGL
ncbi:MAG: S9 family peptidase [Azospirillaceae bacterium]|nr:S9 family peptidase [Azospirillaceae bacterium]